MTLNEELPTFDYEEALSNAGGDADFLKEMAKELYPQVDDDLRNLVTSYNNGNLEAVGKAFHSLKGSAATIGAPRMREAAVFGENAVKNDDFDAAGDAFELLQDEYHKLRGILKAVVGAA